MRGGGRGEHEVVPAVRQRQRAEQLRACRPSAAAGRPRRPPASPAGRDAGGEADLGGPQRPLGDRRGGGPGRQRRPQPQPVGPGDRAAADRAPDRAVPAGAAGPAAGSGTDRNVSGAAGTARHSCGGQRLGVLPGQDRAVQAGPADLADRGVDRVGAGRDAPPRPPPRAGLRAAPRPAPPASSGPTRPRRPARSRRAARRRRPSSWTKPTISASASGRSTGPGGGSTTRPLVPPDQSAAAVAPRAAATAPAARPRPPASRSSRRRRRARSPPARPAAIARARSRGRAAARRRVRTAPPPARASGPRPWSASSRYPNTRAMAGSAAAATASAKQRSVRPGQAERGRQVPEAGVPGPLGERGDLRGHRRGALIRPVEGPLGGGRLGRRHEGPVHLAVTDRQQVLALVARAVTTGAAARAPGGRPAAGPRRASAAPPRAAGTGQMPVRPDGTGGPVRRCRCQVHSITHTAGSDSMPFTRTRTGRTVPAGPAGGENENDVPAGPMLTSPGPGDAAVPVSAAGADEHLRGAGDEACSGHGERGRPGQHRAAGGSGGFT